MGALRHDHAEELGVTRANVDEQLKSTNPDVRRLLGVEGKHGEALGLSNDWAFKVIKSIGNYGENFERNIGSGSKLMISRGLNELWFQGRSAICAAHSLSRIPAPDATKRLTMALLAACYASVICSPSIR